MNPDGHCDEVHLVAAMLPWIFPFPKILETTVGRRSFCELIDGVCGCQREIKSFPFPAPNRLRPSLLPRGRRLGNRGRRGWVFQM